jgi:hypothetical protein
MSAYRHGRVLARLSPSAQRWLEAVVFLLASALGIYGIGRGLAGLYERGQQIDLLWLALTGIAFYVLFAQMGRVHDAWPHRPEASGTGARTTTVPDGGSPELDRK